MDKDHVRQAFHERLYQGRPRVVEKYFFDTLVGDILYRGANVESLVYLLERKYVNSSAAYGRGVYFGDEGINLKKAREIPLNYYQPKDSGDQVLNNLLIRAKLDEDAKVLDSTSAV